MQRYATYIFDLDGTLLNTLDDLATSCNYALGVKGLPLRTKEEVRQFVGNGVRKLIERAVPMGSAPELIDDVFTAFCRHYNEHNMDTTAPYDGVGEMLSCLHREGRRIAVVSNKLYDATQSLCKHFFPDTVSVAIGEKEGIRRKPAPDTVIEALRQLGVSKEGAVYVGDSEVDVLTARNSGMPCISVLWGFRDKDFLVANGATHFVENPSDIINC